LAETLITLAIIGVVAALTLSTVKYIKVKQLEIGFQKAYSTLLQTFEMYKVDNDEPLKPEVLLDYDINNTQIFTKYIKKLKDCVRGSGSRAYIGYRSSFYKKYDGIDALSIDVFYGPQFIMNDGQFVLIGTIASKVLIAVDTNGYNKKPNRAGFDFFVFEISDDGRLIPEGFEGTLYGSDSIRALLCDNSGKSGSSVNGYTCSYYALTDKNYFKKLH
ncbi:type II secretion system protein, partial [bacterium]|nr:type II secretion system protein [bacterium]